MPGLGYTWLRPLAGSSLTENLLQPLLLPTFQVRCPSKYCWVMHDFCHQERDADPRTPCSSMLYASCPRLGYGDPFKAHVHTALGAQKAKQTIGSHILVSKALYTAGIYWRFLGFGLWARGFDLTKACL